jgi:hypothetical protein
MKLSTVLTSLVLLPLSLSACGDDDGGSDDGGSSTGSDDGGSSDGGSGSDGGGSSDGGGTGSDDGGSSDGGGTGDTGGSGTEDTGTGGTADTGSTDTGTDTGTATGTGTDTGATTTDTGGTTTGATTDTGTSTDTGGTTTSATTDTGGATTGGVCDSWVVTYDLTGSQMDIDALMDFTITVQTPYDEDENMGPGTMKIRFTDDGGAPGAGPAQIIEYNLVQNFVTGGYGTYVTTDLVSYSGPEPCGTATGTLSGDTITWNPAEMDPLCQDGTVSCSGGFCGSNGAPPEGDPFVFDEDCSGTMDLDDFVFTSGIDNFTMDWVVLSSQGGQTTSMRFEGTKTDESLDAATPDCVCG